VSEIGDENLNRLFGWDLWERTVRRADEGRVESGCGFQIGFFFVLVVGWRRGVGGSVGVSRTAEGRQL